MVGEARSYNRWKKAPLRNALGQRGISRDRAFALHAGGLSVISAISWSLNTTGLTLEHSAGNSPRTAWGTPKSTARNRKIGMESYTAPLREMKADHCLPWYTKWNKDLDSQPEVMKSLEQSQMNFFLYSCSCSMWDPLLSIPDLRRPCPLLPNPGNHLPIASCWWWPFSPLRYVNGSQHLPPHHPCFRDTFCIPWTEKSTPTPWSQKALDAGASTYRNKSSLAKITWFHGQMCTKIPLYITNVLVVYRQNSSVRKVG